MRIWGIDYGSKMAGTTAIASTEGAGVRIYSSSKGQDADQMILDLALGERPEIIFLDAPLSLPGAYFGDGDDYFYRPVDREVGAMSPMFLGGLTARAMRLKKQLEQQLGKVIILESYPKLRARELELNEEIYKKDFSGLSDFLARLKEEHPHWQLRVELKNWHEFDALLALSSAERYQKGAHRTFGPEDRARIYI